MDVLQMDGMYNISLMGGQARAILIEGTQMVERARQIHGLSRTATAALGRTLMATSMMGSMLKGENESLTVTIKGGGPIGTIMAVGKADASVKGYVAFPDVELPRAANGKLPVGAAVGKDGRLTVVKDLGLREPYVGMVNLVSGEIAEDFAMYFTASEQVPSLVSLGVLVGERVERALISLGREELEDMIREQHGAQVDCHFCNKRYELSEEQLRDLLKRATDRRSE